MTRAGAVAAAPPGHRGYTASFTGSSRSYSIFTTA
jgi:hypothetical protein